MSGTDSCDDGNRVYYVRRIPTVVLLMPRGVPPGTYETSAQYRTYVGISLSRTLRSSSGTKYAKLAMTFDQRRRY
jgi:hypothetical protein